MHVSVHGDIFIPYPPTADLIYKGFYMIRPAEPGIIASFLVSLEVFS